MSRRAIVGSILVIFVILAIFAAINFAPTNDKWLPILVNVAAGLIGAALITAAAAAFQPVREWITHFFRKVPSRCRILIVGLGRSGKTTLVRKILTEDAPRQETSTPNFDVYEQEKRLKLDPPYIFKASISDYKGQKLSNITINGPSERPDFFGLPGKRLINSIVFIVDFFEEELDSQGNPLSDKSIVDLHKHNAGKIIEDRVKKHNEYITRYTIEQMFELCYSGYNLFSVRLIINKIDLLRSVVAHGYLSGVSELNMEDYAMDLFSSIYTNIKEACEANNIGDYSAHIASAKTGENIRLISGEIFEEYQKRNQK